MNLIESIDTLKKKIRENGFDDLFLILEDELKKSLHMFWEMAGKILDGTSVKLLEPPNGYYNLENNFFSAMFLYSYYRAGIASEKRILYSAINQCLRGMVTGCDNLLDDEYKKTLETSLPEKGKKFRSVLDIMVSDRVLFELSLNVFKDDKRVLKASEISLRSLVESGYQEASEEGGIDEILMPDKVLSAIHHFKTGILFKCPWAIPSIIESIDEKEINNLNQALYNIGMGCQVMDDMTDIKRDIQTKHHNYVASLIYYKSGRGRWKELESLLLLNENKANSEDILTEFDDARDRAIEKARSYLTAGLNELFDEKHRFLVELSIEFLATKIGVEKYFREKE